MIPQLEFQDELSSVVNPREEMQWCLCQDSDSTHRCPSFSLCFDDSCVCNQEAVEQQRVAEV